MPTFQRADKSVSDMAKSLIAEFKSHEALHTRDVRVDYMFAFPDRDEEGQAINDALKHQGVKALGLCRKVSLKDRAKGMGDAEIVLDGDWWQGATTEEARALLDHELHHIAVSQDNDDLGRPKLKLRKHDHQFGWFKIIAMRHGQASQECQQAKAMMDNAGQLYWPTLASGLDGATVELVANGKSSGAVPLSRFQRVAQSMNKERAE